MPNSLVTGAEIDDDDNIVLSIDVGAFKSGEYVEVSGYATQTTYETSVDGGFATFSEIREIELPNSSDTAKLTVTAKPTREFQQDLDVTVAVRVSKVWVTVLSAEKGPRSQIQPQAAGPYWAWGEIKGVGGPDEYSSAEGSAG